MDSKQTLAALAILLGGTQVAAAADNVDLRSLQLLQEEGVSPEEFEAEMFSPQARGNYSSHSISSGNYSSHSISSANYSSHSISAGNYSSHSISSATYSSHSISGRVVPLTREGAIPAPVLSGDLTLAD